MLLSNGMDCNMESQRSYGLIGSGAYHKFRNENAEGNSLQFGAFSAFSALRASPLKESFGEEAYSTNDLQCSSPSQTVATKKHEVNNGDNSSASNKCAKLQHEVFFEKQQEAMRQLMQGLLAQPTKNSAQKQLLAQVQESSAEASTMQEEEPLQMHQITKQVKEDANLKIEELSNSKVSQPAITRQSRWQQEPV